jgi:hypothetical protein
MDMLCEWELVNILTTLEKASSRPGHSPTVLHINHLPQSSPHHDLLEANDAHNKGVLNCCTQQTVSIGNE